MPRRPKKYEPVKQWELDDEMRAVFIRRGMDTQNQFLINMMMRGREAIKKLPSIEELRRMARESNPETS